MLRGRWRWRAALPLSVFVVGLLVIALLLGVDELRNRAVGEDLALLRAVSDVQMRIAIAHLWTEEHVTGDEAPLEEAYDGLERSLAALQAMLGRRAPGWPPQELPELSDAGLRRGAEALEADLALFRQLTARRVRGYEQGREVGTGSPIDVEYDELFESALQRARDLERDLESQKSRDEARSRRFLLGVVAGWLLLVAGVALALWSWDRHRRRVEEALAESRRQLLQSQKMDAVGRLAGGLAHDINNYLAAVRGHCELVLMRQPEERTRAKMTAVLRIVEKASGLIHRLLGFSRMQPAETEVVSVNRLVRGLAKVMDLSLGESVRLQRRLAADLWHVRADPAQLEQLVVNLLVNARDAMPEGGDVVISTANRRLPDPAGGERQMVELAIRDTGCGIPPPLLDRIFEPFLTTKKESGHSGLGLSVVYGIVRQHGGEVQVESELGRGTAFRILLPRCDEPETVADEVAAVPLETPRGDEHILLVDDNTDFRRSTAALLEELGYRVATAASGEEALAFVEAGQPVDLLVSDVVMPGIGGAALIERVRSLRPVPAILVSGHDAALRGVGAPAPGTPMLRKLFSVDELARAIRRVLDE